MPHPTPYGPTHAIHRGVVWFSALLAPHGYAPGAPLVDASGRALDEAGTVISSAGRPPG